MSTRRVHLMGRDPGSPRLIPACGAIGKYRPALTSDPAQVTCVMCRDGFRMKDAAVMARMRAALTREGN